MQQDRRQRALVGPLSIQLGPDTEMTLRFVSEPTKPRRRHRGLAQHPRGPVKCGPREAPSGSGDASG
jgi:hypothetical protein